MRQQSIIVILVAVLLTMSVPFFVANNLKLGNYAKSPQEVSIRLGSTALVAGGRAKIWFAGGDTGGEFEIRSKNDQQYFPGDPGETYSAGGIKVELLDVDTKSSPPKARFKVTWKN